MIVIIHSLYFLVKYCLKFIRRRKCLQAFIALQSVQEKVLQSCKTLDAEANISFDPPVYKQRYGAVQQILLDNKWRAEIKKIVDFGCAEFGLFQFIKRLCRIEQILEVDVDEDLLKENLYRIHPLTVDYLNRRTEPLVVEVLAGSISDPDQRLLDTDVVIGIEIIEHLFPDTLDALPYNIFGFIKPKIAMFTTPNADFNEVFPNFRGFRHYDHKFEWSRQQFKLWATNITNRFPEYSVSFRGIGKGPAGTEHLGCCSQMAIFEKESGSEIIQSNVHTETSIDVLNSSCTCKKCLTCTSFGICTYYSCTKLYHESLKSAPCNDVGSVININNYYKIVEIVKYPFEIDERSPEQKILDELKYRMCLLGNVNGRFFSDELNRLEIPLNELVFNQYTHFTTNCEAREILEKAGYKIEECIICGDLETCVIYEPEMDSRSSTPSSEFNDDSNITDKENWSTTTTDGETSEWEVSSDIQRGSWTDNITSQEIEQTEILESVYEIVDNLISNLELEYSISDCSQNPYVKGESIPKEKKYNNLENSNEAMQVMYDSGYYKSSTTLTASTQSGFDLLDGDILDDHFVNSTNIEESDKMQVCHVINVSSDGCSANDYEKLQTDLNYEHNTIAVDVAMKNMPQAGNETYEIRNCKTSPTGKGNLATTFESILPVTPNVSIHKKHHLKDSMNESVPGTSNSKKKRKMKRFENDDADSATYVPKDEDIEKNVEINNEVKQDEVIVPEVAQIPEPIVENGDLANNNRDMEGNNYPDAQQNEQQNNGQNVDGNDNENVVLQNNINDEAERNEDVENRNADVEEEEGNNDVEVASTNSEDGQGVNELEIEFASREALFDPNSEIDLLEEFNNSSVVIASNAADVNELIPNVVLLEVNVNSESSIQGNAVLPINADPFPNWLLHLLGADIVDEGEPHDEPHFYCQGDGVGVHPSFIEDDFDEDHSSSGSDTTSTGSTSDDAIADPTVSEVEVVSLPDDTNDVRPEQNTSAVAAVTSENQDVVSNRAGTSSAGESADEYFDTLDESLSINSSNRSENKN